MQISYVKPDIKTVEWQQPYNLDLMGRMLMDKVARFEKNYANIQGQIDQYGSMPIVNEAAKEYATQKLQGIVSSVNEMSSGDLSDFNNVQKINNITSEFSRDKRIVNAIADTKKIQNFQQKYLEDLEKDPANITNYTLFNKDVERYAKSGDPDKSYAGMTFMKYVDIDKSFKDQFDKMKANGEIVQQGDGRWWSTVENKHITPERIEEIVYSHINTNAPVAMQIRNNARYNMEDLSDNKLAEMYRYNTQTRAAETKSYIDGVDAQIKLLSNRPDQVAEVSRLQGFKKIAEGNLNNYNTLLGDENVFNTKLTQNRGDIIGELYTSDLVRKYKAEYAFKDMSNYQLHDTSLNNAEQAAMAAAVAKSKSSTSTDDFKVENGMVTFDPQTGSDGVVMTSAGELGQEIESTKQEIASVTKQMYNKIAEKYPAGVPGGDIDAFVKLQRDKLANGATDVDPAFVQFHNQLAAGEQKLRLAGNKLQNWKTLSDQAFVQGGIANKIPEQVTVRPQTTGQSNRTYSRQEVLDFFNENPELKRGIFEGAWDELKGVFGGNRTPVLANTVKGNTKLVQDIRNGQLTRTDVADLYGAYADVFDFRDAYIKTKASEDLVTRYPFRQMNMASDADKPVIGKLKNGISFGLQMAGEKPIDLNKISNVSYANKNGNLVINYEYEESKDVFKPGSVTLDKEWTANNFGGMVKNDAYSAFTETLLRKGSLVSQEETASKDYTKLAPVVTVPVTTKDANGRPVTVNKNFFIRLADSDRAGLFREGKNPYAAKPDGSLNIDTFHYMDPVSGQWILASDSMNNELSAALTVEAALAAMQRYLQIYFNQQTK